MTSNDATGQGFQEFQTPRYAFVRRAPLPSPLHLSSASLNDAPISASSSPLTGVSFSPVNSYFPLVPLSPVSPTSGLSFPQVLHSPVTLAGDLFSPVSLSPYHGVPSATISPCVLPGFDSETDKVELMTDLATSAPASPVIKQELPPRTPSPILEPLADDDDLYLPPAEEKAQKGHRTKNYKQRRMFQDRNAQRKYRGKLKRLEQIHTTLGRNVIRLLRAVRARKIPRHSAWDMLEGWGDQYMHDIEDTCLRTSKELEEFLEKNEMSF